MTVAMPKAGRMQHVRDATDANQNSNMTPKNRKDL